METNKMWDELLKTYAWEQIVSKNPYMYSYFNKDKQFRLNHYFTTGTITVQGDDIEIQTFKGINSDDKLEETLCKIEQIK